MSRRGPLRAAAISRLPCHKCQVHFPLAREVEVCVQEIHPESPFSIWTCLSPLTTRGGSETFHLKQVMTPGFFKTGVDACKKKAGTPQDPGPVDDLKRVAG